MGLPKRSLWQQRFALLNPHLFTSYFTCLFFTYNKRGLQSEKLSLRPEHEVIPVVVIVII